jgi:hypothetical protein
MRDLLAAAEEQIVRPSSYTITAPLPVHCQPIANSSGFRVMSPR